MIFKYTSTLSIIVAYYYNSSSITFQIKSQKGHFLIFIICEMKQETNCPGGSMAEANFKVANTTGPGLQGQGSVTAASFPC